MNNEEFFKWIKDNATLAGTFMLLAGTNAEILEVLSSNFANIKALNAPYSEKARKRLNQLGYVNLARDLAKIIIQVSSKIIYYSG